MTLLLFVLSACSDGAGLRCWRHRDVINTSSFFPIIKRTHQTGEADGEKAGYVYEVSLIGRKTLILVSI